jgi:RHS repeat-associated protein
MPEPTWTPWPTPTAAPTMPTAVLPFPTSPSYPTVISSPPSPSTTPATPPIRYYDPAQLAPLPKIPLVQAVVTPTLGGIVASSAISLTFPTGAYSNTLAVSLVTEATYPRGRKGLEPVTFVSINLTDTVQGVAVHKLLQPAELRINLATLHPGLVSLSHLDIYHFDETSRYWEKVPSVRTGNELVATVSDFSYYSLFDEWDHDWLPTDRLEAGETNLLSGSASFSFPVEVPRGTGGMLPKIQLAYSSTVPDAVNDGLVRPDAPRDNESSGFQADWVGWGWSLGLGRITSEIRDFDTVDLPILNIELNGVRETIWCVGEWLSDSPFVYRNYDNSKCLDPDGSGRPEKLEFRTEKDTFMRIVRHRHGPTQGVAGHGIYFEVWDKAGTYYRFGYNANSEHLRGQHHHPSAWGYSLDRVVDTHGNRMEIEYYEDNRFVHHRDVYEEFCDCYLPVYDSRPYSRAAYPAVIRYTFNTPSESALKVFGTDYHREVRFNENLWRNANGTDATTWTDQTYWSAQPASPPTPLSSATTEPDPPNPGITVYWGKSNRVENPQNPGDTVWDLTDSLNTFVTTGSGKDKYYYMHRYKLDQITSYIKLDSSGGEPLLPFRKYVFTYESVTPTWTVDDDRPDPMPSAEDRKKLTLKKVQEYAGTGAGLAFTDPLYKLSLTDQVGEPTYTFTYTPDASLNPRYNLTQIKTALGGTVDYKYQSFTLPTGEVTNDDSPPNIPRYRVFNRKLDPASGDPAIQHTYDYGTARYNNTADEYNEHFIGHDWVTVFEGAPLTDGSIDRSKNSVKHFFFTNKDVLDPFGIQRYAADTRWLRGKEYQTDYIVGQTDGTDNGNKVKRRLTYSFAPAASINHPSGGGFNPDIRFVQLERSAINHEPSKVNGPRDLTAYTYAKYGNVEHERVCANHTNYPDTCSDVDFTRRTLRFYGTLDQADTGHDLQGRYRFIVDRMVFEGVHGADDTSGNWWPKVTYFSYDGNNSMQAPLNKGELKWERRVDCYQCSPETTADTKYDYDQWGNVTGKTTYDQFGTTSPTNAPGQGTARTVTTAYETKLNTFVRKVTQPTQTADLVWEEADFGSTSDLFNYREAYRKQAPLSIRDSNDNNGDTKTLLSFDHFGRLIGVVKPPDTAVLPTEAYEYPPILNTSTAPRFQVKAFRRLDDGRTLLTRTYYDGMGRVMLTMNPQPNGVTLASQYASTFYDERGRKRQETVPYQGNVIADDTTVSRDSTKPSTYYEYDQFGDATATQQPDGMVAFTTPVREHRKTYIAERGATVWPVFTTNNASFETGADVPTNWSVVSGSAARSLNGIDGRFALQVSAGSEVKNTTTFNAASNTYTLSWLARLGAGVSSASITAVAYPSGGAVIQSPIFSLSNVAQAPDTQWKLYHWSFTIGSAASTSVGFVVLGGAVEIDAVRVTVGNVRERLEQYDSLNNPDWLEERMVRSNGLVSRIRTEYAYDKLDRLKQTVAQSSTTDYIYVDTVGKTRLNFMKLIDSDRGTWIYTYDSNGNTIKQENAKNQVITFCYDRMDRLTKKFFADVPCSTSSPPVTMTYDNTESGKFRKGRRYQMTTGADTVTYSYDRRGRLATEARSVDGATYSTSYQYNANDSLKSMTYPDNEVVNYTYNGAASLNNVAGVSTNTYLTDFTYDIQARPLLTTLGNGAKTQYTYDGSTPQRLNLLQTWVKNGGGTLVEDSRLTYTYDTFGNILSLADPLRPAENRFMSYDSLNRLVEQSGFLGQMFVYDDMGNLTVRGKYLDAQFNPIRDSQPYWYTTTPTPDKPHAVRWLGKASWPARFEYDANGNMTRRGAASLQYDPEGRLTNTTQSLGSESYGYDGDGVLQLRASRASDFTAETQDNFTSLDTAAWDFQPQLNYHSSNFNGGTGHTTALQVAANGDAARKNWLNNGRTVRLAFRVDNATPTNPPFTAALRLENFGRSSTGADVPSTYQSFGVVVTGDKLYANVYRDNLEVLRTQLFDVSYNIWYRLELQIDDANGFRVVAWREGFPDTRSETRFEMPSGRRWRFHYYALGSGMLLDDYAETTQDRNLTTAGIYRPSDGNVYLRNTLTTGIADLNFFYGTANDKPVAGDWNGDGIASIGIYRVDTFYLRNSHSTGFADTTILFGVSGDLPVVGDWNGDGVDTIGIYRNGTFYLRNANAEGSPDITLNLGQTGDIPIAGDWTGKGFDSVGVFRPSTASFLLRHTNTTGTPDVSITYGAANDKPTAGDWDGDGDDTIGIYRNGAFYLRNTNTTGSADILFYLGITGDLPIAGDWDGLPAPLTADTSRTRIAGKHYEVDTTTATITKRYYAGDRLLATKTGGTLSFVQPDHLGSSSTVTNIYGGVVSRERYTAFGERRKTQTTTTDFLYTGQRFNALSGLYHYSDGKGTRRLYDYSEMQTGGYTSGTNVSVGFGRYYDSVLGRFVQADPITPSTISQDLNRFSYSRNNPVRYTDPNGHCGIFITVCVGAAAGGIISGGTYLLMHGNGNDFSWGDFAGAVGGGVVAGGISGAAILVPGTQGLVVGALVGSAANLVGYGAGVGLETLVENYVTDPTPENQEERRTGAIVAAATGLAGSLFQKGVTAFSATNGSVKTSISFDVFFGEVSNRVFNLAYNVTQHSQGNPPPVWKIPPSYYSRDYPAVLSYPD